MTVFSNCEHILREIFKSFEVIRDLFGFALPSHVIGPEILHHFLNKPNKKLKPKATWSHTFSNASESRKKKKKAFVEFNEYDLLT